MTPVNFAAQTLVLGAPPKWDEENNGPCIGLPVLWDKPRNNFQSILKFSWRERFQILFGRNLCLTVHAFNHPPVALEMTDVEEFKP